MLSRTKRKESTIMICLCALLFFAVAVYGAMPVRQERPDPKARREQQMKDRMQEMSKELESKAEQVSESLVKMLKLINSNQIPNDQTIASARKVLEDTSSDATKFPAEIGCEYLMLEAWVDFFSNDTVKAGQSAARAVTKDPSNKDAQITEAAISILSGETPNIRRQKPQLTSTMMDNPITRNRTQRRPQPSRGSQISLRGGSGDILNFDIDAVKPEMFGRKLEAMEIGCSNKTTLKCDPSKSNMCILLWQLPKEPEEEEEDSSSSSGRDSMRDSRVVRPDMRQDPRIMQRPGEMQGQPARPEMMYQGRPDMPPMGMYPGGMSPEMMQIMRGRMPGQFEELDSANALPREMRAFGKIYRSEFSNSDLQFLAVNIDEADKAEEVIDEIFKNPQLWPQVLKSQVGSGVSQFDDVKLDKPVLTVADKSGTIKYAGPAAGFLAPMVLSNFAETSLVNVEGIVPDPNAPAESSSAIQNLIPNLFKASMKPKVEATSAAASDETIDADTFQAGKLYEATKTLFIPAGKKGFITTKTGVDNCRTLIRDYSHTEYADKARELLRQLPDRDKERYKITDEEMGL